jgi:hypothetical protein
VNNLILYLQRPEVKVRPKAAALFGEDFWLSSLSPKTCWRNILTEATAAPFGI